MKYRKKPVEVEACQFVAHAAVPQWLMDAVYEGIVTPDPASEGTVRADEPVYIETLEGTMAALPGDWIVQGVEGEIYPVKASIFAETYEPVPEDDGKDETRIGFSRPGAEGPWVTVSVYGELVGRREVTITPTDEALEQVSADFNPSGNVKVAMAKTLAAALISYAKSSGEANPRAASVAAEKVETGAMYAVKAITSKPKPKPKPKPRPNVADPLGQRPAVADADADAGRRFPGLSVS